MKEGDLPVFDTPVSQGWAGQRGYTPSSSMNKHEHSPNPPIILISIATIFLIPIFILEICTSRLKSSTSNPAKRKSEQWIL